MLDGKKIAVLVEQDFEDSELIEPIRSLKNVGARIVVIGSGTHKTYTGKRGDVSVDADITADMATAEDYAAVIVPGGYAPDKMRLHQSMVDIVKSLYDLGRVVAAICHGPQLLISANIVKGRKVTSWPSVAIDLKNAGADWTDAPVVRDGNLITSRKPADLPKFNKAIIEALLD